MKSRAIVAIVFVLIVCCRPLCASADSALWNTGYYAGWMQDYLAPSDIDFSALTHVIHFAAIPKTDGSLDTATNVLSFPVREPSAARGTTRLLGDIVIAYETTEREARAEHKPFAHHLAHLAVHGFLHLAGYDHAAEAEAEAMETLETAILARLDVPDPYVGRHAIDNH